MISEKPGLRGTRTGIVHVWIRQASSGWRARGERIDTEEPESAARVFVQKNKRRIQYIHAASGRGGLFENFRRIEDDASANEQTEDPHSLKS